MRVVIIGLSGAGKTTLGRTLATRLGCALLELDSIYHQPSWTPLPDEDMRARIDAFIQGEAWVLDGNYRRFIGPALARATDVVWLDLPRPLIMRRVITRSLRRVLDGQPLWNGNRERLSARIDPDHPIRWAWRKFAERRHENAALFASPEVAHARTHRLRTPKGVSAFIDQLDH